ncbi:TPA: hypothetical protein ACKE73_004659 [Enterobacter roggenkampii]
MGRSADRWGVSKDRCQPAVERCPSIDEGEPQGTNCKAVSMAASVGVSRRARG